MLRYRTVLTRRGNSLAVVSVGPGSHPTAGRPPVLLLHPLNMRKECWLGMLPALAAERMCLLLDHTGHGESTDDDTFSLEGWVDDCVDVIDAAAVGPVHVVGASLSGAVAIGLAARLPGEVLSITGIGSSIAPGVADDPDPASTLETVTVEELFATLARQAVAPTAPPEVVATVEHLTNRHGAAVVRRVLAAAAVADATGWTSSVTCPALWLTGEYDATSTVDVGAATARSLRGTHAVMPGVGHLPMVENPELVLRHLAGHLKASDGRLAG